ncbi:class I SAM-dependent methyltransferase [Geomicrobium sediminis]|uniref:Ubiquinone/menaquinone biosynthesis C-methylase UbiE n=1 Tax=Geomicrobium sediminis TaxID=1347788 RepID=A0ABS2PHU1_9BACL|nr:class I SAM-dependent methyltransferase [Geomicrobium sediminis]MBM7634847.1 ubiquinone/menaquinone biosynthesis C-methylase UbiE [Geomicrobium sediminis]
MNNEKHVKKIQALENEHRHTHFPASTLLKLLPITNNSTILDLGAGTGYVTLPAAKETSGNVYALDRDLNILTYLEQSVVEQQVTNITTLEADFKAIPLQDQHVDIVIASISLHEIKPLSSALDEAFRVLKRGGMIQVIEIEATEKSRGPRVSSKDMSAALEEAGFVISQTLFPDLTIANEPVYIHLATRP